MQNEVVSRLGGAMKNMDLVFVDIETTGLDFNVHEIIEIASVRVKQDWSDIKNPKFTILDSWSAKIMPEHFDNVDPKAFLVNGFTKDDWNNAILPEKAIFDFAQKTKNAIMVGHNVSFDSSFIENYFNKYKIKNEMHYCKLDTISIVYGVLGKKSENLHGYSLPELCNYFDIKNENPHTALSDALTTFELFKKIMNL